MRFRLLPLFVLAAVAGCDTFSGEPPPVTLTNKADRPLAAFVVDEEQLALIDPAEAIRAEDFDRLKIDVGATVPVPNGSALDVAEGVAALVYARPDQPIARIVETYGEGAAAMVGVVRLSARELRQTRYRIVLHDYRVGLHDTD